MRSLLRAPVLGLAIFAAPGLAQGVQELAIETRTLRLDGDLDDWPQRPAMELAESSHVLGNAQAWIGKADVSARLWLGFDSSHLYVAGQIEDDHPLAKGQVGQGDWIELHLGFALEADGASRRPEDAVLQLYPLDPDRPYEWIDHRLAARPTTTQLGGIRLASRRLGPTSYSFEAAVPFHHYPDLQPGALSVGFNLALRDQDPGDSAPTILTWNGRDPSAPRGLGLLHFQSPGPLRSPETSRALLDGEVLTDLPSLLVPLSTLVVLVVLLRLWPGVRAKAPWLRPTLMCTGIGLFTVGVLLPGRLLDWREQRQRDRLQDTVARLGEHLSKFEAGTLASYRGQSRDRAVVQLLHGEPIARQRYTSYRPLAQIAPDQFGPAYRHFDDLPIRPYWLPLAEGQPESFQFDPPLRGSKIHLVVARPYAPAFTFVSRPTGVPRLELELDFAGGVSRRQEIELDRPFVDSQALGRDHWEVCVVPITLERDLRSLSASVTRGVDFRLVGISLEGTEPGRIVPVLLGTPSRNGVLTDLRGPWPVDAGIELAPGATAKIAIPRHEESPQRLWFFYRAIYPGVPTAILGEKVAEIVLHFADGTPKRTITLEHQTSVFYELAFRNTRDAPPEDSPASIALDWIDESKERHVNLGYPVTDLPADAPLEAIEFRNVADYRMHFRSVVFVNERAAAPQDPPDSPLVRGATGQERLLDPAVRATFAGSAISIYRDGRLSEATAIDLAQKGAEFVPRSAATEPVSADVVLGDGARRSTLFTPLRGDGWDGAVLGVADTDIEWAASVRSASRWGFLCCLLSAPFLLVLLSELLAKATSLRTRLMTVTSLASLAPLGLLSLVLVQVLESGHAADVEAGMRTTVGSAIGQLESQKQKVQASVQQWLAALTRVAGPKLEPTPDGVATKAVAVIGAELEQRLLGQLPPEWRGGFLRLDWQPLVGASRLPPQSFVVGAARTSDTETPARLEPGIFMHQGELRIGVRAEQTTANGTFMLTAGRPVDDSVLGAIAPGHDVLLTDVRGYPLAAGDGRPEGAALLAAALDPDVMAARERALQRGLEARQPVVERSADGPVPLLAGSEVLRDLQETPRALLVIARPDERATLDLAVGRIPVRAFFLLVAGSLVVLSVFLSYVVSGRISRPIERLERGAQALSRGQLETRVQVDDGGQIGALTRAFNQMAVDLQGRLQDLQALNRTMRDLSGEHDENTTVDVLRQFCQVQTPADSVHLALADQSGQRVMLHLGGAVAGRPLSAPLALASMAGPFVCWARSGELGEPWRELAPGCRSLLGLPIVFGGQTRGLVVLGFAHSQPLPVDLDLLSTVVAQAAVAFERCQLQRLAVQDPVTGAFTPDYFRRRVVDEVSLAQQRGRPLALLSIGLGDGERRPRGLRRFASLLHEHLGRRAVLCHAGNGQFTAALPFVQRVEAEATLLRVAAAWDELVRQLPENEVEAVRPVGVVVQFPDEAASAEFLFEALAARVSALQEPGASAMESDESLQRAGVTTISPAMRAVFQTLRRVAPTDIPILLEGETGVGKEVLTNLVHRWSRRAGGPLVKVHCAALSETLLASELFGHEKGAFTGAERRKIGRFEQADGGTLFLDEVGEISLDVQVKLLRVLQEGEVDRIGGSEPVKVDVRVIAATNRDIALMVQQGGFREDLYYRLQGMVVKVPPLRERKQELASLVEHFRDEVLADGHTQARSWSTDAMDEMFRHDWPGNIRQLRNTVFRAMVMARGDVVQLRDLQAVITSGGPAAAVSAPATSQVPAAAAVAPVPPVASAAPTPVAASTSSAAGRPAGVASPGASEPTPEATRPRDEVVEPTLEIPRPASGTANAGSLPPRLLELLRRVEAAGRYTTQEHMLAGELSHRTALRDLQALVEAGVLERVGSRRGTFYRPIGRHGELAERPEASG